MDFFGFDVHLKSLRQLARDADAVIADPTKYSIKIEHLRRRIESPDAIHLTLIASKLAQKITSQRNPEQPSPSLVQLLRYLSHLDAEFVSPMDATLEQNNQRWQELTAHLGEKCYEFHVDASLLDSNFARRLRIEEFGHVLSFMFRHVDDLALRVMAVEIAKKMERVQTPASEHQTTVNTLLTAEAQRRLGQVRQKIQQLYTTSDPKTWAVGFYNLCATLYGYRDRKLVGSPDLMQQEPSKIMDWVYSFGILADPISTNELKPSVRYQDRPRSDLQQKARDDLRTWLGIQHERNWYGSRPPRFESKTNPRVEAPGNSGLFGLLTDLYRRHIRAQ